MSRNNTSKLANSGRIYDFFAEPCDYCGSTDVYGTLEDDDEVCFTCRECGSFWFDSLQELKKDYYG